MDGLDVLGQVSFMYKAFVTAVLRAGEGRWGGGVDILHVSV